MLTMLEEIALREHCSLAHILEDRQIAALLQHDKHPAPQKTEQIRRILREKRYPALTTVEQTYKAHLKRLRLPRGVQLRTDRFFEDDHLSAAFRFSTPDQLKHLAEELLDLSQQPALHDLFALIQGQQASAQAHSQSS
jgi:hypothetical protein